MTPARAQESVRDVRLQGHFTTLSPLSHIGESISTHSYLVQEPILQTNGTVEEVFCYSGNAWKGHLRDLMGDYMLRQLKSAVSLDWFSLLFQGGGIGGKMITDIEAARKIRSMVPMVALCGGGLGNQILPGQRRVSNIYPVCREAIPVLPPAYHEDAAKVSYHQLVLEKSFSRKDDYKDPRLTRHLLVSQTKKEKRPGDVPDQMRFTPELLAAGVRLVTKIDLIDVTDTELGCLVAALHWFSRSPFIGGQASQGHGHVALEYDLVDCGTGERVEDFVRIDDGQCLLSPPADGAKERYDQHLRKLYDLAIEAKSDNIRGMLAGSVAG